MRILSVVTLFSPDGAYGGPTRVAVNQGVALRDLGHTVMIAAGARGYADPPTHTEGVPLRLFGVRAVVPGTGFAGLTAPGLLRWLGRALPRADVVHVHAARDLVTLPAALLARRHGVPYVLQTHGMIDASTHPLAGPLDAVLTRPALRGAGAVLYLTPRERTDLLGVSGAPLPLVEVLNGVPTVEVAAEPASPPEVLYLARLHPRKRPTAFVEMAVGLAAEFPDVTFSLVGPDEGEGHAVRDRIEGHPAIRWEGALAPEGTLARMARASVYVLPSVDEPFPMSVLEAMSLGRPVVVTESCGLAPLITGTGSGIVVGTGAAELADAVRRLLADPALAASMGAAGATAVRERLSMSEVAIRLATLYASI